MKRRNGASANKRTITRREFIKTSGIAVGAAAGGLVFGKIVLAQETKTQGPGKHRVTLNVNGKDYDLDIEPRVTLMSALRNRIGITSPKPGCDRGSCGACTVLVDDVPVVSCMMLAYDAVGAKITTAEGLAKGDKLHPIQSAFIDCDAFQCGYCTAGFMMSLKPFVERTKNPTPEQIRLACQGNICRCAAYNNIFKATKLASERIHGK